MLLAPEGTARVWEHKRDILLMIALQTAMALATAPCAYFANMLSPIFSMFVCVGFGVVIAICFMILPGAMDRYAGQIGLEVKRCHRALQHDAVLNGNESSVTGA